MQKQILLPPLQVIESTLVESGIAVSFPYCEALQRDDGLFSDIWANFYFDIISILNKTAKVV